MSNLTERTKLYMTMYIEKMAKATSPEQIEILCRDATLTIQDFARQCTKNISVNNPATTYEINNLEILPTENTIVEQLKDIND